MRKSGSPIAFLMAGQPGNADGSPCESANGVRHISPVKASLRVVWPIVIAAFVLVEETHGTRVDGAPT